MVEVATSSLPDCALSPEASHRLQQYRKRNYSMKTQRGSRGFLNTSLEDFNIQTRGPASSNISLRSPVERSVRGINTRQRALISGVINRLEILRTALDLENINFILLVGKKNA